MRRIVLFGLSLCLAAACLGLGFWQLRRLSARRAVNRSILAGRAQEPLQLVGPIPLVADRRARVSGELDEAHEFVLRDRVIAGVPAVVIVTPLHIPGRDTALLVNRGYVPAPDAVDPRAATWTEPGEVQYEGTLVAIPDRGDGQPLVHADRETWKSLDLRAMRARLPYPVAPVYLIVEADSAAGEAHTVRGRVYPFRAQPPPLNDGPHLMYAVQWFGIAAAITAFGIIFVLRGGPTQNPAP